MSVIGRAERRRDTCEVRVIESVECFRAELESVPFNNAEVLVQRHIEDNQMRREKGAQTRVAVVTRLGILPGGRGGLAACAGEIIWIVVEPLTP